MPERRQAMPGELVINGRFLCQKATGVQRVAGEVTRAIDRLLGEPRHAGLAVRIVVPRDAAVEVLALRHIVVERAGRGRGHLWEQLVLPWRIRGATLLCLCNSAPIASLLGRHRVAAMLHDQAYLLYRHDYSLAYRLFHRAIDRLLLARARPLFTVSESEREVILARHPNARAPIVVAANGSWIDDRVAEAATAPAGPVATSDRYALYVGGFSQRKNIDTVFTAALALARRRGIGFRLVGPENGISASLRARVPDDLAHLVRFMGYVPDAELPALYREAVCLVYPSFYEASGLPPSEAMSFGCPVVVSDLAVLRERCGDAAMYCDPTSPEDVVTQILALADDPTLARAKVAAGYRQVATFTWRDQATLILQALRPAAMRPAAVATVRPSPLRAPAPRPAALRRREPR